MNFYDFTAEARNGSTVSMGEYQGKVVLVVNTATDCGFTPQYEALQACYLQYKNRGFAILDFPCNQFGLQAPGSSEEIHARCTDRYGISFHQFAKTDVLGSNANPLFRWLCEQAGFEGFGSSPMASVLHDIVRKADPDYQNNNQIKWNFTKFLIGRDGQVLARFEPTVPMNIVAEQVKAALQ